MTTNEWDDSLTGEERRELQFAVGWVQTNIPSHDLVHRKSADERERAARMFYLYLKSRGWRLVRFDHPETKAMDRISELERRLDSQAIVGQTRDLTTDPAFQRLSHQVASMGGRVESARGAFGGRIAELDQLRYRTAAVERTIETLATAADKNAKDIATVAGAVRGIGEHFYSHQHTEAPGEIDLDALRQQVQENSGPGAYAPGKVFRLDTATGKWGWAE